MEAVNKDLLSIWALLANHFAQKLSKIQKDLQYGTIPSVKLLHIIKMRAHQNHDIHCTGLKMLQNELKIGTKINLECAKNLLEIYQNVTILNLK